MYRYKIYIDIVYKIDSLSNSCAAVYVTKSQSRFVLKTRKADPSIQSEINIDRL